MIMHELKKEFLSEASKVILGKDFELTMSFCAFLSGGHLLVEDIPGVGKTTFAKTLAKILNLNFSRIQFTSDLMPSDIVGAKIYQQKEQNFVLMKGPLFNQFILADELNRSSPKAQSALLEAMEERQITIDGECLILPEPFFVVATQNPHSQVGTHLLPESQLDRFIMKLHIGYPSPEDEKKLITGFNASQNLVKINPLWDKFDYKKTLKEISEIKLSDKLLKYILDILNASRIHLRFLPLSPRAGIDITKVARCYAYLEGRDYVKPDDVKIILTNVVSHRLISANGTSTKNEVEIVNELLELVYVDQ
jgi:MoxR-like ATPase